VLAEIFFHLGILNKQSDDATHGALRWLSVKLEHPTEAQYQCQLI
jgi:hypothetical protein